MVVQLLYIVVLTVSPSVGMVFTLWRCTGNQSHFSSAVTIRIISLLHNEKVQAKMMSIACFSWKEVQITALRYAATVPEVGET